MNLSTSIEYLWNRDFNDADIDIILNNISTKSNVLYLTLLWEAVPLERWEHRFDELISNLQHQRPNFSIFVIVNSWYKCAAKKLEKKKCKILYIDFFLMLVVERIIKNKESIPAIKWDYNNRDFLFLTGKPNKINRIRLLYKLAQKKLLEKSTWSLFPYDCYYNQMQQIIPELTERDFKIFLKKYQNNPDNITIIKSHDLIHYGGIPFATDLYQHSLFQVIAETSFLDNGSPWITEKVWLSIINKRPFIIAGQPFICKKLENLGFKTFREYLKLDYDNILNAEDRLDTIIENIIYWLDNIQRFNQEINNDIEFNYKRLLNIAKINQTSIQNLIGDFGIRQYSDVVPLFDDQQHAQWENWYNRVRDPSWPDCPNESDFTQLPQWIQDECINIHNYIPS